MNSNLNSFKVEYYNKILCIREKFLEENLYNFFRFKEIRVFNE